MILIWAFIGIIRLTNLFNFLEGIDGYISTEVIFIGVAVFILFNDRFALLLAVIVSGFLFWKWQKAKIFMGDEGSTLLGFTINKEQLDQAHRKHAYQHIVQAGFSQKTVLCALGLNLLALILVVCAIHFQTLMLAFASLTALIIWIAIKWVDKRKPFDITSER